MITEEFIFYIKCFNSFLALVGISICVYKLRRIKMSNKHTLECEVIPPTSEPKLEENAKIELEAFFSTKRDKDIFKKEEPNE